MQHCHSNMHPHNKFGIPTLSNIRDMHWIRCKWMDRQTLRTDSVITINILVKNYWADFKIIWHRPYTWGYETGVVSLKIKRNDTLIADTCPQAANYCALFWEWAKVLQPRGQESLSHRSDLIHFLFKIISIEFLHPFIFLSVTLTFPCNLK